MHLETSENFAQKCIIFAHFEKFFGKGAQPTHQTLPPILPLPYVKILDPPLDTLLDLADFDVDRQLRLSYCMVYYSKRSTWSRQSNQ